MKQFSSLHGLKYIAVLSAISLYTGILEIKRGVSYFMASNRGIPNPSERLGETYANAFEYNAISSSSETLPLQITLSFKPKKFIYVFSS